MVQVMAIVVVKKIDIDFDFDILDPLDHSDGTGD